MREGGYNEIGNLISSSIAVMTPYKTACQSSTVLTSYMYGTPVISSNIEGLREVIQHRKTGYLVGIEDCAKEWLKGIEFICNNLSMMSKACRKYFVDNFSDANWKKYIPELLTNE